MRVGLSWRKSGTLGEWRTRHWTQTPSLCLKREDQKPDKYQGRAPSVTQALSHSGTFMPLMCLLVPHCKRSPKVPRRQAVAHPAPGMDMTFSSLSRVSEEARWANMLLVRLVQVAEACLLRQQGSTCPTLGASSR